MAEVRESLAVWLYGTKIAELHDAADGRVRMSWTPEAYQRWGEGARVMSHLLPIGRTEPARARVRAFVEGLLPEGIARTNHAMDAGVRPDDTFGMIRQYGRDTAGALVFQLLGEPEPVRVGRYVQVDDAGIAARLRHAERHVQTDPRRGADSISLAGLQPKIGLHRIAGDWVTCADGAPSTLIVKLAHPKGSIAQDVVDTETAALALAREVGLTSVHADVHDFAGERAIVVSRYDRILGQDGSVDRIHQEDMAQALGIDTGDPARKFQHGTLLPSLAKMAEVLRYGGAEPDALLALMTFNFLLGNIDSHAKNISVLRLPDGSAKLAPAYDIAMHLHHDLPHRLSALDINGKVGMFAITVDDLVREGESWGIPIARARSVVTGTIDTSRDALDALDTDRFPGVSARAFEVVRSRIRAAGTSLARSATPGPQSVANSRAKSKTSGAQNTTEGAKPSESADSVAAAPRRRGPRPRS